MLLYDSPISGNCYKVRLILAHLGIPYERTSLDVVDRSNRPDVLGGLNPALRVPTLVLDDGRPLGESGAILWYFGEGTRFVPTDSYERAQVLQWMFFEQYDHEPAIAVVRFWVKFSGRPEAFADRLDERKAAGVQGTRGDGAASRGPGVLCRAVAERLPTSRSTPTRTWPTKAGSSSATIPRSGAGSNESRRCPATFRSTRRRLCGPRSRSEAVTLLAQFRSVAVGRLSRMTTKRART